jgi:hypothetical protein
MSISLSGSALGRQSSAEQQPEREPPPAIVQQYTSRANVHYQRTIMRSMETKERTEKQRQGIVRGLRSAK